MGSRGPVRRPAGTAFSTGRAHGPVAINLRLVWARAADLGAAFDADSRFASAPAPRFPAWVPFRVPVVHGQLLLGARHHVALWRHASVCADASADRFQPGAGLVLRAF